MILLCYMIVEPAALTVEEITGIAVGTVAVIAVIMATVIVIVVVVVRRHSIRVTVTVSIRLQVQHALQLLHGPAACGVFCTVVFILHLHSYVTA